MPITKPKTAAPPAPSSRPENASRAQSVTPSEMFPPVLSQDTRLKRPLTSRRSGDPRTAEGRARSSLNHPRRMLRHKAMVQCARITFGMGDIIDPDEAQRTFASTNQQTEGLTQTLPQKSHTPAKRGPTSVNELKSALGILQQHCKTD